MCGIFGIASLNLDIDQAQLERWTSTLSHRGPDDSGTHLDEYAGLGHRRLSIIDLSGGGQPIYNEDQTKCIVFNGEIYNYQTLRRELMGKGHRFTTNSDTETILHAYEEWGADSVQRLRGMFSYAIWDIAAKELFIARDRLGIKPLFYGQYGHRFFFASEMKAILADANFPREIDDLAVATYFNFSYIPAPLTIFRRIRKLPAGHTLTWKHGEISIRKYWDIYFNPDHGKSEQYFINTYLRLFHDAVQMRLMSEVPLGAFLSGGIDSSLVVALMSKGNPSPVNTFCIGFGGQVGAYFDERGYAQMVAERYGTHHKSLEVMPRAEGLIGKLVTSFDEPFADDSAIPSFYVCQMARREATVALSGLGGDEAFAGYERYLGFKLRSLFSRLPQNLSLQMIPRMVNRIPERRDGHYTINHLKRFVRSAALPADLSYIGYISRLNAQVSEGFFNRREEFKTLGQAAIDMYREVFNADNVTGGSDSLNRVFFCDIKTYLPEDILAVTDRMSMYHSLEVRVPFIDHKLLEFCATIPPELKMKWYRKKYLLKKIARPLLPEPVINHRKQGFVGPMAQWLKHDLKSFVVETLSPVNLEKHGYLNHRKVNAILEDHFSGKEIHDTLIWSMVIFQSWFETYIDR
jgi:asparagine synthase (glutamine-hydrolysing)